MSGNIETHAVEFGQFNKDYEEAAERIGISKSGVFILATYADMIAKGEIDEAQPKTAHELLLDLADEVEKGVKPEDARAIVERLRYLAQFIVMRPVPTE